MAIFYDNPKELNAKSDERDFEEKVRNNEMNPVLSVYLSLLNLGIEDVEHHNQQKYIRLSNFVTLITFIGALIYVVFAILWENWYWLGAIVALGFTCVSVLMLNSFGKTNISRLVYLLVVNALVYLNALFIGPNGHLEQYFAVAVIVPFLIYDLKETAMIIFGVVLPIVLIYTFDFVSPLFTVYNLTPGQQSIMERVNIMGQLALAIAGVYQLVNLNKKTELELEASNAQMMLQTAELRRSNNDLEQFAYIISHDLKAPVRNISSFMNLLVNKYSTDLSPEAKEFVGYSHTGAKRLERLIDDVLAYCRIGTNLPRPVPVNVNDIISTIRFELRDKLSLVNGSININRELPVVNNVHASLMYHVFQNLISNGLKFNKSDKPEIEVSWTNSLNYYTFSIHDNGIGISKEYTTTIFQMFRRLHGEQEYDGTGIGLAICKKIVEYYHGEIWFDSEPGKGTTFYFTVRKF
ncbi:MAG: ATP-binding protein [Chitinophagales bacterium]